MVSIFRTALGFMLLGAMTGGALAQATYKCSKAGTIFYADRPCDAEGQTGAASIVPSASSSGPPKTDYLQYMSPECRRWRSAANGARRAGMAESDESDALENDRCSKEERLARLRAMQASSAERDGKRLERQRQQDEREACVEMTRIRQAREAKWPDMTAGEKADFERFKASYLQRCAVR